MIKCPVCYGKGKVPVGFYDGAVELTNKNCSFSVTSICGEPTCKSCNGTGIVMEYQPNNTELSASLKQAQEDAERYKKLSHRFDVKCNLMSCEVIHEKIRLEKELQKVEKQATSIAKSVKSEVVGRVRELMKSMPAYSDLSVYQHTISLLDEIEKEG